MAFDEFYLELRQLKTNYLIITVYELLYES